MNNLLRVIFNLRRIYKLLNTIEIGLSVMTSNCIQNIVKYSHAHTAPPLDHRGHHLPFALLRVVALHAGDGIPAAPTADCVR